MEHSIWLLDNIDRIGTMFCLLIAVWHFHKELNSFKKQHAEELAEMRKAHREEREVANADMKKALEDIAKEIKIANQERSDIKHLLESVKDFQIMVTNSLHAYDTTLSQIGSKLKINNDRCDLNQSHFFNDIPPSFPIRNSDEFVKKDRQFRE